MKKLYQHCCRRIFLLSAGSIFFGNLTGSAQCDIKTLPFMWIPQGESIKRAKQFTKAGLFSPSKYGRLSKAINKNEVTSIWYPLAGFQELLMTMENENPGYANLRIYIASFDKIGSEGVPESLSGTLMVIFSPADNNDMNPMDLGKYYYISQDDGKVHPISKTIRANWIAYFNDIKMPALKESIKKYKKELNNNYPDGTVSDRSFSDTRSILYTKKDIDINFKEEIQYQKCHNKITIDGIQLNFAAFTRNGNLTGEGYDGRFRKRLVVLFEYTITEGAGHSLFYVDSQPDFPQRLEMTKTGQAINNFNTPAVLSTKILKPRFVSDNGQLCPPNCPPPPPDGDGNK